MQKKNLVETYLFTICRCFLLMAIWEKNPIFPKYIYYSILIAKHESIIFNGDFLKGQH